MPQVPLINDQTWKLHIDPTRHDDHDRMLGGAWPRKTNFGECAVAKPMDPALLIPRSEWIDRIKQKDQEQSWLEDLVRRAGIRASDQASTNFCHAHSIKDPMEVQRCVQGHPYVELSAMAIGGPITGWRNRGAYPEDDLMQAVKFGTCPASMQDSRYSFSPSKWQKGWEEECAKYQVDEWTDGLLSGGKAFDALVTFSFLNIPCPVGYQWWGHALHAGYRVLYLGQSRGKDRFAVRHRNSWGMDYGDAGFVDLEEGRGTPDIDLFAIGLVTATG